MIGSLPPFRRTTRRSSSSTDVAWDWNDPRSSTPSISRGEVRNCSASLWPMLSVPNWVTGQTGFAALHSGSVPRERSRFFR